MIELYQGDCMEVMHGIESGSIDAIITDPPYGTTACKWDSVIQFEPMWEQLKRLIKSNGAIVLFGSQPFTSVLICSNLEMFKYSWVWNKVLPRNHLNAKKQPLRATEDIPVFYSEQPNYNPQKTKGHERKIARTVYKKNGDGEQVYGKEERDTFYNSTERYPTGILNYSTADQAKKVHPTQKPVPLMEYLIRTYTNKGGTVLDFTMGSGTTGVAAKKNGRSFIGIEKDPEYFKIAENRIKHAEHQLTF